MIKLKLPDYAQPVLFRVGHTHYKGNSIVPQQPFKKSCSPQIIWIYAD